MDKKFYRGNRRRLLDALSDTKCMVIVSSGYSVTRSADESYPFQVNANFYYLTGITQEQVHLVLLKDGENYSERFYIDPYDEHYAKWMGHRLTRAETANRSTVLFEPDETTILDTAVPEYVTGRLVAAVRESYASEVVARRMAMDSAGKNARAMIDDLQLQYNRARQSAITQEITEIVAGSGS